MKHPHSYRDVLPCIVQIIKCLSAGILSSLVFLQVPGHFSLADKHLSAAGPLLNSDLVTQTSGFYPAYEKAVNWLCSLLTCPVCPVEDELAQGTTCHWAAPHGQLLFATKFCGDLLILQIKVAKRITEFISYHKSKCWCYCSCNSLTLWPEMLQEGSVQSRAPQAWWSLLVTGGGLFLTHMVGGSSKDMDPVPQVGCEVTAQLHHCVTGTALGLRIFCYRPMSAILPLT